MSALEILYILDYSRRVTLGRDETAKASDPDSMKVNYLWPRHSLEHSTENDLNIRDLKFHKADFLYSECITTILIDYFTILEIEKIQTKDVVYRTVTKTKKITPKIGKLL